MKSSIELADDLSQQGKWREAVDLLGALNHQGSDIEIERKLVDLRLQAPGAMSWPKPTSPWAGDWQQYPHDNPGIDEIDAIDFSAQTLAKGILGRGALIVRGLVSPEVTQRLKENIDSVIQAREGGEDSGESPWQYQSPYLQAEPKKFAGKDQVKRAKVKKGSIWVAESPRMMQQLMELFGEIGLREILTEYFAEAPSLSVRKWVLRKISPDATETGWHQDGRFMGTNFHSVNMWLPLSECGGAAKASGLQILPTPRREIHETGTHRAAFNWTVGHGLVEDLSTDQPVCDPYFQPGDAMFFDHYNLHRTGFGPHLSEPRYAVESWFFSSSSIPEKQIPILF